MSESECVLVRIPHNIPDNKSVAKEWIDCLTGKVTTRSCKRERHIVKVPPLLLKSKKGRRNSDCYEPAVVSLGPYHHNRPELAQAEKYKLTTLEEYCLGTGKTVDEFYNKVFEVVHDARNCYMDGSTDSYTDEEFSQMMLRDACFVLFYMECLSRRHEIIFLNVDNLGAIGVINISRDILLLENQIPFVILEVLLKLKYPDDKGEDILNGFFNYLNYGEVMILKDKKVLEYTQQPLHLLELYRSYFISLFALHSPSFGRSSEMSKIMQELKPGENYNYVKLSRSFASVTQLKTRWIYLRRVSDESTSDMEFKSYRWSGEFKLAHRAISSYTKAIYLNMIAYEMCPRNPNDFRVSTYLRVMKSLITQREDVRELRHNDILVHCLGSDEEVAKMYDEIEVPAVNLYMFHHIRQEIEKLHDTKYKTWFAELTTDYFGSPWKAASLLVGSAILITGFVQAYFTINQPG